MRKLLDQPRGLIEINDHARGLNQPRRTHGTAAKLIKRRRQGAGMLRRFGPARDNGREWTPRRRPRAGYSILPKHLWRPALETTRNFWEFYLGARSLRAENGLL